MNTCVTCDGSSFVTGLINLEPVRLPCYTCRRAGRIPQEEPEVKPLPAHLHPMIRKAISRTLPIGLNVKSLPADLNTAVVETAARYAMSGSPEMLQDLEVYYQAARHQPTPEEPKRGPITYDVTGLTFRPCRTCRIPIAFASGAKGGLVPVERDGVTHFGRCPGSKEWSGKNKEKAA